MAALSKSLSTEGEGAKEGVGLPGTGCIQRGYEMLEKRFDEELGGFGKAPKFPQPSTYVCVCVHKVNKLGISAISMASKGECLLNRIAY